MTNQVFVSLTVIEQFLMHETFGMLNERKKSSDNSFIK